MEILPVITGSSESVIFERLLDPSWANTQARLIEVPMRCSWASI